MYWHDGWDWLRMSVTMTAWVFALGIIAYVAVRRTERESRKGGS
jgi:hypothetical protein